jgi:hypothetical protein
MLEQMERALYAEDPKFASALEGSGLRSYTRRRLYAYVAGFLVGLAALVGGVAVRQLWVVSVAGFLIMLGCAALAMRTWRRLPRSGDPLGPIAPGVPPGTPHPRFQRQPRRRGSMMDRIEERWQRRRDEQGQ